MSIRKMLLGVGVAGLMAAPAMADVDTMAEDVSAALDAMGPDEISMEARTEAAQLYMAAMDAHDDGDMEDADEKLAEAKEVLGIE